ncbi:Spop [Aphelenchoides bicaudatus]|nr:Spop [Aphelenchoides bicaudatus]
MFRGRGRGFAVAEGRFDDADEFGFLQRRIAQLRNRFMQFENEHAMNLAGNDDMGEAEIRQIREFVDVREGIETAQRRLNELRGAQGPNRIALANTVDDSIDEADRLLTIYENVNNRGGRRGRGRFRELFGGFGQERSSRSLPGDLEEIEKENSTIIKWEFIADGGRSVKKTSRLFSIPKAPNAKFALFFDSKKYREDDGSLLYGLVLKESQKPKPLNMEIKLWIEDSVDGRELSKRIAQRSIFTDPGDKIDLCSDNKYIVNAFRNTPRSEIVFESQKKALQNSLNVSNFESHSTFVARSKIPKSEPTTPTHHLLGNKLWELYQEGVGYDAIIEAADGKEFKVMSAILMSHSDAFKTMFSANYKESKEKRVKIDDISSDTLEAFICWLYTGQLNDESVADELFVAADKYIIEELKHSDKELEIQIMKFVTKLGSGRIREVFESKAWLDYLLEKEACKDLEPGPSKF